MLKLSQVRQLAKIPFKDPSSGQDPHAELKAKQLNSNSTKFGHNFVIADVHLSAQASTFIDSESLSTFLGPLGLLLVIPLPPAQDDPDLKPIYRVSCPPEKGNTTITSEYLQKAVDAGLGLPQGQAPTIEKVLWSSRFRVRSAVAKTFYKRVGGGIVMLVGDAAHVHSPAGLCFLNL